MSEETPTPKLKPLERRFAQLVASGVNPTQALRDLKFRGRKPQIKACKMMARPHIREYIEKLCSDTLAAAGITRTMIVKELGRIAFADPRKMLTELGGMKALTEIDDDTAAVIAGLDVEEIFSGRGEDREQISHVKKVKFWNKREALAELAAISGMKRETIVLPPNMGPGLQIAVYSGGQVNVQQNDNSQHVTISLPKPA
jgi:phage terminase small subunit